MNSLTETSPETPAETPIESLVDEVTTDSAAAYEPLETTADLQPGDTEEIVNDNPFVDATDGGEVIVIPDTQLEGPQTTSTSPNVTTVTAVPKAETISTTPGWIYWAGGAGILAALALLFFGRRSRQHGTPAPIMPAENYSSHRFADTDSQESVLVEEAKFDAPQYPLDDDSPTDENLVLDADLVSGTGLDDGTDLDLNQDIGFATPVTDVELPFEPEATATTGDTDILPLPKIDETLILQSEIMSEEVTEQDLQALEVSDLDKTDEPEQTDRTITTNNNQTITEEIDLDILAQDYEDELTATQALDKEIARAAAELEEDLAEETNDEFGETAVLPMASVTDLDVTTAMSAANSDEVVELDETAEMPIDSGDDKDDATLDLKIESGKHS